MVLSTTADPLDIFMTAQAFRVRTDWGYRALSLPLRAKWLPSPGAVLTLSQGKKHGDYTLCPCGRWKKRRARTCRPCYAQSSDSRYFRGARI